MPPFIFQASSVLLSTVSYCTPLVAAPLISRTFSNEEKPGNIKKELDPQDHDTRPLNPYRLEWKAAVSRTPDSVRKRLLF